MNIPAKKKQQPIDLPGPPTHPQKQNSEIGDWREKRSTTRFDVSTEVNFSSETNFYVGFTADLSTGGLFVVTWDTQPIGTSISLTFTLSETSKKIRVDGMVRWVREFNPTSPDLWPGMGIEFTDLSDETLEAIQSFVSKREPLFYE